jgi:hypothetical protein
LKFWLQAFLPACLLALFLHWPSLDNGFRSDDYPQRAMLLGKFPAARSPLDLFDFARGTPGDYRRLLDFGHLPWWSEPQLKLRMLRPLASLMLAFDQRVLGADPHWHHAHSLLWLVLLLMAAGRLLWQALPPTAASLALLMFAAAPCHTIPVGWLANRSTLVASALAFWAVSLHLKNQSEPSAPAAKYDRGFASAAGPGARRWSEPRLGRELACAGLTALALLTGEYALASLGYGLAFSWLGATRARGLRRQLRAAAPLLIPLAAYVPLHWLSGSGIAHSGYYLTPLGDPLGYARAALIRAPVLAADVLFGLPGLYLTYGSPLRNWLLQTHWIPTQLWLQLPGWTSWHVLIGYAALGFGALLTFRLLRTAAEPALRWLALGAGLALLPCVGSLPEDRLLTAATLGASALLATTLLQAAPWRGGFRLGRTLLWLACLWVPLSALDRSYDDIRAVVHGSNVARSWARYADMPEYDAEHTRVYVLSSADFNSAVNLPWMRWVEGHPLPLSYRRLSTGALPIDLLRIDDRTLELRILTINVAGTAVPSLYRGSDTPIAAGDHVDMPGLRVDVLNSMFDNPTRVRFRFDRSVDDPSLWFVYPTEAGLRRQSMPAIGTQMRFPFAQYRDISH